MKKSILIAALGLFSLSAMAQDAKPEEGFVFHNSERKSDYFYQEPESFKYLLEFLCFGISGIRTTTFG